LAGCDGQTEFLCQSNADCSDQGICEANQRCSFPDEMCESGRRYGEYAPSQSANQCVPPGESLETDGSSPSSASDAGTSGAESTGIDPSGGGESTGAAAAQSTEVTVTKEGGGRVLSSPTGIDCGETCTYTWSPRPEPGIFLDAVADDGWNFVRWTGDCFGIGRCEVLMQDQVQVAVAFSQDPVLGVQKIGNGQGRIVSSPDGIDCDADCGSDASPYVEGTTITLSATPEVGTIFVGWSGAGCTGTDNCTVTLNGNTTIEAEFILEKRTLDLDKTGPYATSGSALSMPEGIDCEPECTTSSAEFDYGTSVTLAATPYMTSGYEFSGFGGDCTGLSCTLEMTENKSVELTFSPE
jgi:hypothetical protein